ncbi:hypothetical protein GGI11_005992 [Coemansia sp. RSA 2049]|nr:hypothetical protein GGI11_005992 [Coemansia sp. RSA 2049]KAJ2591384.1 hypothetical protein EV177_008894 [Coemansia sp. RSA 1804]
MGLHSTASLAVKRTSNAKNRETQIEATPKVARVTTPKDMRVDPSLPGVTLTTWEKVKAYAKFYFGGFKQLRENMRTVKAIRARVDAGGSSVSREEFQIQVRHSRDMVRLVPFALTVLVFEELSPLILLAVPSLCPSTCVTYGQAIGVAKKHDKTKLRLHGEAVKRIEDSGIPLKAFNSSKKLAALGAQCADTGLFALKDLGREDLRLINRFMGATGVIATPIFSVDRLRGRLLKHLEYLRQDDLLLAEDELLESLPLIELHNACQERGIPSADREIEDLRKALATWAALSARCKSPDDMLPIVWSRLVLFNKNVVVV